MAAAGANGVAARWPLVARTAELAEFATILTDPHRRGVLIFGPAGVGRPASPTSS